MLPSGTQKELEIVRKHGKRQKNIGIQDEEQAVYITRNELITRMLADTCEICGSTEDVEAHHIRKLADLKKKWKGKPETPKWVQRMIAMRRKTLFTCKKCHLKIHGGKYDGQNLRKSHWRAVCSEM